MRAILAVGLCLFFCTVAIGQESTEETPAPITVSAELAAERGCLSCHEGIEDFTRGVMMETIQAMGPDLGDPGGTKGLDQAAVQPHSAGREARTCESCHSNPVALGEIIPQQTQLQSQPVRSLDHDLTRIVTEDGR